MTDPDKVREALDVVVTWLREDFIVDGCDQSPAVGCVSCEAVDLVKHLLMFGYELDDYEPTIPRSGETR